MHWPRFVHTCLRERTTLRTVTTLVMFGYVDFIAKLVALANKPRVNLTRYHRFWTARALPVCAPLWFGLHQTAAAIAAATCYRTNRL